MNCWWISSSMLLRVRPLLRVHRRERIEQALVLARGEQAPLDAELVHQRR